MPKISEHPAATTPLIGNEVVVGNQSGITKRVSVQAIAELAVQACEPSGAVSNHEGRFSHAAIAHSNRAALDLVTGTNSGDQDLSGYSPDDHLHTGVYDPAGTVTTHESTFSHAAITHDNRAALDLVTGTNSGDQDLSGYSPDDHLHTGVYDTAGTATSVLSGHTSDGDPHSQYLTATDGNAAYDVIGAATAALSEHTSAVDPHSQYLTAAEGAAAFDALGAATAIKDKTAVTGLLVGNGTTVSAAVSGTDLKSINGISILGSGNAVIAAVTQVEVDFLSLMVTEKEFTIADTGVTGASKINCSMAYEDTANNTADEVAANSLICYAGKVASGSFTLMVMSLNGSTLSGKYKINYTVG